VQDELELVVVEGAELAEALLDLLHSVHILRRLSINSDFTRLKSLIGGDERAFKSTLSRLGSRCHILTENIPFATTVLRCATVHCTF